MMRTSSQISASWISIPFYFMLFSCASAQMVFAIPRRMCEPLTAIRSCRTTSSRSQASVAFSASAFRASREILGMQKRLRLHRGRQSIKALRERSREPQSSRTCHWICAVGRGYFCIDSISQGNNGSLANSTPETRRIFTKSGRGSACYPTRRLSRRRKKNPYCPRLQRSTARKHHPSIT